MSNTRNVISTIPATFQNLSQFAAGQAGQLVQARFDFDTNNSDVAVFVPQPDSFIAVMGMVYAKQIGHILTFSYGDVVVTMDGSYGAISNQVKLTDFEMNSGNGICKELNGWPLITAPKGKALLIKTTANPLSILLYTAEFKLFRF